MVSYLLLAYISDCQIDGKYALRRMRNSGRRSREGAANTSSAGGKGNATDGDDDDDEEEGEDDDVAVCAAAEGTSAGAISVVEAIVKQKVLDEVCSANPLLVYSVGVQIAVLHSVGRGTPARSEHLGGAVRPRGVRLRLQLLYRGLHPRRPRGGKRFVAIPWGFSTFCS